MECLSGQEMDQVEGKQGSKALFLEGRAEKVAAVL